MVAAAAALIEVKAAHYLLRLHGLCTNFKLSLVTLVCSPMQTLYDLHHEAKLAHLDVSPANSMLVSEAQSDWDKLRMLDLGLAVPFQPGS